MGEIYGTKNEYAKNKKITHPNKQYKRFLCFRLCAKLLLIYETLLRY